MGILTSLFKKDEKPLAELIDSDLGKLVWSEADEAWVGYYNSFKFSIAFDYENTPSQELLSYAKQILRRPRWLKEAILNAMKDAMEKNAGRYDDEFRKLKLNMIHFYMYMDEVRIFVDFTGCKEYRLWGINFKDLVCEGMVCEGECG